MEFQNWQIYLSNISKQVTVTPVNLPVCTKAGVTLSMLRLDAIHPVVSGNKLFKILPYLQQAIPASKTIISFGGHYSNHLAALAFACRQMNLKCVGIVRADDNTPNSPTITFCRSQNMQLVFTTRAHYKNLQQPGSEEQVFELAGPGIIIPEGGFGPTGAAGAAYINSNPAVQTATHICVPVGSATTLAGIAKACLPAQQVLAFAAIKNMTDVPQRLIALLPAHTKVNVTLHNDFHFGGFAKHTAALIAFMNTFYEQTGIPLDVVYTSKMMFGLLKLIEQNYFKPGAKIVAVHTGGLQGNAGLPLGTLLY